MKNPVFTLDRSGRIDLDLYNEATAFALTSQKFARSGKRCERVAADLREWERAVREGRFLPIGLMQDDSFVLRIVKGKLRPQEQEEWIGCLQGVLDLSDGKLAVSAGMDFLDDPDFIIEDESARIIAVPPGKYAVTVYSYLSGVNGELDLPAAADGEHVATWFRQTRPGQPLPRWLKAWTEDEGLILGFEYVDFLVQLEPYHEGAAPPVELEDRLMHATQKRRPEKCPLGLPVENLKSLPKPKVKPVPLTKADVLSRVADITPQALGGKPILHPVSDLWQVYRIPFYCNDSVGCEIIIEFPLETQAAALQGTPATVLERKKKRVRIGFGAVAGRWELMKWLKQLATPLSSIPDGTGLEMVFADEESNDEGRQRWAGTVRAGQWQIEAAWPRVSREVAAEAVGFCRSLSEKTGAKVLNVQEADAVLERLEGDILFEPDSVQRKGLQLIPKDPLLLDQLAIHIFQHRYPNVWPFVPILDEEDEPAGLASSKPAAPALKNEMEALLASAGKAKVVFKGLRSQYRSMDFGRLGPGMKPVFRALDDEVDGFAWEPLGNLVCDTYPGLLIRAYTCANGNAVLSVYCSSAGVIGKDLYSRFNDGSSLTTTTTAGLKSDEPERKIYRRHAEHDSFMMLLRAHNRNIFEHAQKRKVRVVLAPKNIAGVAKAMDDFLVRSTAEP